ncbi:tachykinin-3b isoform X1 [Eleginops maclovinus]|uniref:tachykinin-3b isoform X1 n=1 Tax=Eleginops maclovinus TaxID=56733 RepID=UPI003080E821
MEKTPICRCSLTSLISLIVLVLFPLMSECKVDTYTSRKEATPECCRVRGDAGLKKSKDVDYDSFVGLMGRSAAHPNRRMAHTLTDVFGRITERRANRGPIRIYSVPIKGQSRMHKFELLSHTQSAPRTADVQELFNIKAIKVLCVGQTVTHFCSFNATGKACPCPRRYLPTRSDKYALRFQRFV